ncbi:unnamed protein product, partial [Dicrocoelium dendriticum]
SNNAARVNTVADRFLRNVLCKHTSYLLIRKSAPIHANSVVNRFHRRVICENISYLFIQ